MDSKARVVWKGGNTLAIKWALGSKVELLVLNNCDAT
jgi:hypothetical protein